MAGRKVTIEFLGKNSTDKTTRAVEQRFGKLGKTLDRVGQRAGKVLAVGLGAAAIAAVKMGKAAAADDAAAAKLANTLNNAAGATKGQIAATESWITAQGKALGVSDDELRPALGRLAVATKDVGEAQKLAALAMDVSAGSTFSLDTVTKALAKAQNGNLAGLAKLGIATKDASGKTLSLDQITKNLAATYRGAASTAADTAAGRQKKLSVAFGELQEEIGAKLLPVMEKLTDAGMKVVDWIDKNQTTAGVLVTVLGTLAVALYAVSLALRAAATASAAWAAIMKLGTVATVAQTVAQYALGTAWVAGRLAAIGFAAGVRLINAAWAANPIGLAVIAIVALVAGLVLAYKKVDWFRKAVDISVRAVGKIFAWLWNNAVRPALLFIGKALGTLMLVWGKMLQTLGKVPGFGWAKTAGDKMSDAGRKALNLGDVIKKIPTSKHVKITADTRTAMLKLGGIATKIRDIKGKTVAIHVTSGAGGSGKTTAYAHGTNFHPGGMALVGEEGPEIVDLPRGSKVFTNSQSLRMAGSPTVAAASPGVSGGITIVVNGALDPVAVAEQIRKMLLKLKRTNGVALGLA